MSFLFYKIEDKDMLTLDYYRQYIFTKLLYCKSHQTAQKLVLLDFTGIHSCSFLPP